jgi:hypothetical protein
VNGLLRRALWVLSMTWCARVMSRSIVLSALLGVRGHPEAFFYTEKNMETMAALAFNFVYPSIASSYKACVCIDPSQIELGTVSVRRFASIRFGVVWCVTYRLLAHTGSKGVPLSSTRWK